MSLAPTPSPSDAHHDESRSAVEFIATALDQHDKAAAAAQAMTLYRALDPRHPARHPLRGLDNAIDIGRWDLACRWLAQVRDSLNSHSSVESYSQ